VGCREQSGRAGLLRVVLIEGRVVPDLRGTLPGRGAYVHLAQTCVGLAVRRRAFQRAFRVPGPLETEELQKLQLPEEHAEP
jgi:uncharacterized protein